MTEMYLLNNEFQEIFSKIDRMSKLQLIESFNMASYYIAVDEYSSDAKRIILSLKNNSNNYDIPISNLFHHKRIDLNRDEEFLIDLMSTSISHRSIYAFVNYLERESESIIEYRDIIIPLSQNLIKNKLNISSPWKFDENISKLIIGLYDAASGTGDKELANQCLDIWDEMFEKQFGSARQLSQQIMDR